MENQTYKTTDNTGLEIEFYCCQTNDVEPYKETRELCIVVFDGDKVQIDFDFDEKSFDSLIDYLTRLQKYCKEFNKNSIPAPTTNER